MSYLGDVGPRAGILYTYVYLTTFSIPVLTIYIVLVT